MFRHLSEIFSRNIMRLCLSARAELRVRSIAPYVKDKAKDPAVVVVDEKAILRYRFCPDI